MAVQCTMRSAKRAARKAFILTTTCSTCYVTYGDAALEQLKRE